MTADKFFRRAAGGAEGSTDPKPLTREPLAEGSADPQALTRKPLSEGSADPQPLTRNLERCGQR